MKGSKSDYKSVYLQSLNKKIEVYRQELNSKRKIMDDFSPLLFEELNNEHTGLKNKKKRIADKIQGLKKEKVLLEQNIKLIRKFNNYQFVS